MKQFSKQPPKNFEQERKETENHKKAQTLYKVRKDTKKREKT